MRFKNFNSIYWMLAPIKILSRNEELAFDDCKRILDYLKSSLEQQVAILIIEDPVITVVIEIINLVIENIMMVIEIAIEIIIVIKITTIVIKIKDQYFMMSIHMLSKCQLLS